MLNSHPMNSLHILELNDLVDNNQKNIDIILDFVRRYYALRGKPKLPVYVHMTQKQLESYNHAPFSLSKEEETTLREHKAKTIFKNASYSLKQDLKEYPDSWFSFLDYFYNAPADKVKNRTDVILELAMANYIQNIQFVPSFNRLNYITYIDSSGRWIPNYLYGLTDKGHEYDGNRHQLQIFSNGLIDSGHLKAITLESGETIQAEFSLTNASLVVAGEDGKHRDAWASSLDIPWRTLDSLLEMPREFEFSDEVMDSIECAKSQSMNPNYIIVPFEKTPLIKSPVHRLYK